MSDLVQHFREILWLLWGPPNKALSNPAEWRWGHKGGRAAKLETGQWYDFNQGQGGNIIDLIQRETGHRPPDWLQQHGFGRNERRRTSPWMELIELLQRLGRQPDLPRAGATGEAIQERRNSFDERWKTFFEGTSDGEAEHAFRRGIWDRGNACCSPPVLQWAKDYSSNHVAELTRAWLEGWKFADQHLPTLEVAS